MQATLETLQILVYSPIQQLELALWHTEPVYIQVTFWFLGANLHGRFPTTSSQQTLKDHLQLAFGKQRLKALPTISQNL